jgi:hypothetical protein
MRRRRIDVNNSHLSVCVAICRAIRRTLRLTVISSAAEDHDSGFCDALVSTKFKIQACREAEK